MLGPGRASAQARRALVEKRGQCNCRNSRCLKLYCECFASGQYCFGCNCQGCHNNPENNEKRARAIDATLERCGLPTRPPPPVAPSSTLRPRPAATQPRSGQRLLTTRPWARTRPGTARGATARSRAASKSTASASRPASHAPLSPARLARLTPAPAPLHRPASPVSRRASAPSARTSRGMRHASPPTRPTLPLAEPRVSTPPTHSAHTQHPTHAWQHSAHTSART